MYSNSSRVKTHVDSRKVARCESLNGPNGLRLTPRAASLGSLGHSPLKHEVLEVFGPSVEEGFAMPSGQAMFDVILPTRARAQILATRKGTRTAHFNVTCFTHSLRFVYFAHRAPRLRVVADLGQHLGAARAVFHHFVWRTHGVTLTMARRPAHNGCSTGVFGRSDALRCRHAAQVS